MTTTVLQKQFSKWSKSIFRGNYVYHLQAKAFVNEAFSKAILCLPLLIKKQKKRQNPRCAHGAHLMVHCRRLHPLSPAPHLVSAMSSRQGIRACRLSSIMPRCRLAGAVCRRCRAHLCLLHANPLLRAKIGMEEGTGWLPLPPLRRRRGGSVRGVGVCIRRPEAVGGWVRAQGGGWSGWAREGEEEDERVLGLGWVEFIYIVCMLIWPSWACWALALFGGWLYSLSTFENWFI